MIYRYTEQDISRAWQSAFEFTKQHVVRALEAAYYGNQVLGKQDPEVQTSFQRAVLRATSNAQQPPQDPVEWYAHTQMWGSHRRVWQDPQGKAAQLVVEYGKPISQLTQAGEVMHTLYSTMMEASGPASEKWHLYGSAKTYGSFANLEGFHDRPPVRLDLSRWGGSLTGNPPDELVRELVHQMTPALQFLYRETSYSSGQAGSQGVHPLLLSAISIGIDPGEARRLLDVSSGIGSVSRPSQLIAVAGHEFAHGTMQVRPIIGSDLMRDYLAGKLSVSEMVKWYGLAHSFLGEATADIFSMAVSLNPGATIALRYAGGAGTEIREAAKRNDISYSNWKYGDPIKARVIDPKILEDPNSPFMQTLARYSKAFEEAIMTGSANTGDPLADAASAVVAGDVGLKRGLRLSTEPYTVVTNNIAYVATKMTEQLNKQVRDPNIDPRQDMGIDEDTEFILRHESSRFWTIGYIVGKVRPDLIGQEILVTPSGVKTTSGEYIDVSSILPDLEPYSVGGGEVHPVILERAFRAVNLYNRARAALQRGVRFFATGPNPQEVIENWRNLFLKEVVNAPDPTVKTDPRAVPPLVSQASQTSNYQGGFQQAVQAQVVQQTSGQQVITGQGSNVIESAHQHSPHP